MNSMIEQKSTYILSIAVNRPLWKQYDYSYQSSNTPSIGSRVQVSFGYSQTIGIIVDIKVSSTIQQLKPINQLLDHKPLFDKATLKQLVWVSRYYFHPLGEVLFSAIPKPLRKGKPLPKTIYWQCVASNSQQTLASLKRAKKQFALFEYLDKANSPVSENILTMELGVGWRPFAKRLAEKKLIIKHSNKIKQKVIKPIIKEHLTLTSEQAHCITQVTTLNQQATLKPIVLHGITGSGKTEVYLRIMRAMIENSQQILVIVPEIGLTPQLYARFRHYFVTSCITMLHSKLSDNERLQAWHSAQVGKTDILIGTRSAIFTPLPRLAMIILDEEHDQSLKQQRKLRYHARDVAIKRAYDNNIPIILGSATPSIESIHNVQKNNYHYLQLNQRPSTSKPPTTKLLDIRGHTLKAGLSTLLITAIDEHLEAGNQVMLFLNRRGFAPTLFCPQCGWHAHCSSCDNKLTYHAIYQQLRCHYCGYKEKVMDHCPSCNQTKITTRGVGTERLEHYITRCFPNYPIIRIDKDSTSKKDSLHEKFNQIRRNQACIIIGTQMLAKGHDFPHLTLVGILDIDTSLFSTNFRATEYLAQLIIQVSGRAGRAQKTGTVYMQTCQPQHPFFKQLLSKGYSTFIHELMEERSNWSFPPFAHQALIRAHALSSNEPIYFLEAVKASIHLYQSNEIMILGPNPSPMEKRANRYHAQLLISTKTRSQRTYLLQTLLKSLHNNKPCRVKWSIDVDPTHYE